MPNDRVPNANNYSNTHVLTDEDSDSYTNRHPRFSNTHRYYHYLG